MNEKGGWLIVIALQTAAKAYQVHIQPTAYTVQYSSSYTTFKRIQKSNDVVITMLL